MTWTAPLDLRRSIARLVVAEEPTRSPSCRVSGPTLRPEPGRHRAASGPRCGDPLLVAHSSGDRRDGERPRVAPLAADLPGQNHRQNHRQSRLSWSRSVDRLHGGHRSIGGHSNRYPRNEDYRLESCRIVHHWIARRSIPHWNGAGDPRTIPGTPCSLPLHRSASHSILWHFPNVPMPRNVWGHWGALGHWDVRNHRIDGDQNGENCPDHLVRNHLMTAETAFVRLYDLDVECGDATGSPQEMEKPRR